MLPKSASRYVRELRFGLKHHWYWNQHFLDSMMPLAQEETRYRVPRILESPSPNEPTAELSQWHYKYFWNLSRNLNKSWWRRVDICFLQSIASADEKFLNYWILCRLSRQSARVSCGLRAAWFWFPVISASGLTQLFLLQSFKGSLLLSFRSAVRQSPPERRLPWPCQEGVTHLKREAQGRPPWKVEFQAEIWRIKRVGQVKCWERSVWDREQHQWSGARFERDQHMPDFVNQEKDFEFYLKYKRELCLGSEQGSRMIYFL